MALDDGITKWGTIKTFIQFILQKRFEYISRSTNPCDSCHKAIYVSNKQIECITIKYFIHQTSMY